MTEWEDLVYTTAERFGGNLPHPETANIIQAVHARAPKAVERAIDRVALEYEDGTARSPWGLLKSRVAQISADEKNAAKSNTRETTLERAHQWLRNVGVHYDWDEAETELFAPIEHTAPLEYLVDLEQATRERAGRPIYDSLLKAAITRTQEIGREPVPNSGGILRDYDTPELRGQMHATWLDLRPLGLQVEADAIERGLRYQAQRERLAPTTTSGNVRTETELKAIAKAKAADTTPLMNTPDPELAELAGTIPKETT